MDNKFLKSTLYVALVTSIVCQTVPSHAYAIEERDQTYTKKINHFKDMTNDTLEDVSTKCYRYFEEEKPEMFMNKVSHSLDHLTEDAEKVVRRNIFRPLARFLENLMSSN